MSIEGNPVGMACNIKCEYCYEEEMRNAGNINSPLDLEKFLAGLDSYNQPFSLFGGEPLLLDIVKLETIFAHGFKKWGQNGIQTNGTLITSIHIGLFTRYRTHVGFSIDGPGIINSIRCDETLTDLSLRNLYRCLEANISCSLIFTITPLSILYQDDLIKWLSRLDDRGLKNARIHLLESDNGVAKCNEKELIELLRTLRNEEEQYKNLKFDLFNEIESLLLNPLDSSKTCVWNKCDPYTTAAVQGVGPSGERYNCGRTNKEGIQWAKANQSGHERQYALFHTDCMGCKFFLACKGYCPGTAINGDWRRKTEHCNVLYALFEDAETELSFTSDEDKRKIMELDFLKNLNNKKPLCEVIEHIDWHIDGDKKTAVVPVITVR